MEGRTRGLGNAVVWVVARAICAVLGMCVLSGCGGEPRSEAPHESVPEDTLAQDPSAASPRPETSAPFDLGAVMRNVRLAYRASDGGVFAGGHATYSANVHAGKVTLRPYHRARPPDDDVRAREPRMPAGVVAGSALELETVAIQRGGRDLTGPATARVGELGELLIQRGEVIEKLQNHEDGVEQSWTFEREPEGAGDLLVVVAARGQKLRATSEGGLHFAGDAHGLGFRYGHATLVDAEGKRMAVPGRFEEGAIVLRVAHDALERAAYPLVLDPVIGPEIEVGVPVDAPRETEETSPAVAFDGTNYLVVWTDDRNAATSDFDIYGALVSATGAVLSPNGIGISTVPESQTGPAVSFDGTNYLVVWTDARNSATTGANIYGARVTPAGTVLNPFGIGISTAAAAQIDPAVSFDGTSYLVVWDDDRDFATSGANIYGARVAPSGFVYDPDGFAITSATGEQNSPAVAFDGTNHLVVWQDYRNGAGNGFDIYGARVSQASAVMDPGGIAVSSRTRRQGAPAVAFDGTNYLVVWADDRNGGTFFETDIFGARIDPDGTVLDTDGFAVATTEQYHHTPAVTFDGTNYLVAWHENPSSGTGDIHGTRVTPAGVVLDPGSVAISTAFRGQSGAAVAFDGTGYLVVWQDDRAPTGYDIFGARVDSAGGVLDPDGVIISARAHDQTDPAVAFDGASYLVVWQDYRRVATANAGYDVYAARISRTGTVLDPSGIVIAEDEYDQSAPAVAFDGTNYLVVWEDENPFLTSGYDIHGARVSPAGGVVDPGGVDIWSPLFDNKDQRAPAVAFDGTNYLVVWQDGDIRGARVTPAVGVLGGVTISTATGLHRAPAVAFDGTNYLVVWADNRNGGATLYDIYGARTSPAGGVLDPSGIAISTAANSEADPVVAFDGSNLLVVWTDHRASATFADIYGARMSPSGVVLDPNGIPIAATPYDQSRPAVAFDDTNFFVVWQDQQSPVPTPNYDAFGARVSPAGTVLDSSGFAIETADGDQRSAVVVAGTAGQTLVVYDSTIAGAVRTRARLVNPSCTVLSSDDATCDGVNDDCDGAMDEDYVGVPTTCGVGPCASTGATSCVGGAVQDSCTPGAAAPADTACNDVDDDCDGATDEDYVSVATTCGVGACASTGTTSCVGGAVQDDCAPGVGSTDDTSCDGVDDDCDGATDEDFVPIPTTCGVGPCASTGATSCVDGTVHDSCTPGVAAPADTACNGIDDDCDGATDEDYASVATTCGVGACASTGTTSCVGGAVQDDCAPGVGSMDDASCDGVDDDCDGATDEDFVSVPTTCGVGACASTGATSCVGGAVQDSCASGAGAASDAVCNGVDDDCDSATDEDYASVATTCGVGACASTGATSCENGVVQDDCTAGTPAAGDATCDDVDDDCDGETDEDTTCPEADAGDTRDAGGLGTRADASADAAPGQLDVATSGEAGGCNCELARSRDARGGMAMWGLLVGLAALGRRRVLRQDVGAGARAGHLGNRRVVDHTPI